MKVVRQAPLELSGGSTPDQLRPPRRRLPPLVSVLSISILAHPSALKLCVGVGRCYTIGVT